MKQLDSVVDFMWRRLVYIRFICSDAAFTNKQSSSLITSRTDLKNVYIISWFTLDYECWWSCWDWCWDQTTPPDVIIRHLLNCNQSQITILHYIGCQLLHSMAYSNVCDAVQAHKAQWRWSSYIPFPLSVLWSLRYETTEKVKVSWFQKRDFYRSAIKNPNNK